MLAASADRCLSKAVYGLKKEKFVIKVYVPHINSPLNSFFFNFFSKEITGPVVYRAAMYSDNFSMKI